MTTQSPAGHWLLGLHTAQMRVNVGFRHPDVTDEWLFRLLPPDWEEAVREAREFLQTVVDRDVTIRPPDDPSSDDAIDHLVGQLDRREYDSFVLQYLPVLHP